MDGQGRKGQVSEASRRFLAWPQAQRVAASDAGKATPRQYVDRGAVRRSHVPDERAERARSGTQEFPARSLDVALRALRPAHDLELLHPTAPVGFRHVNVALGIDRERVAVGEVADLVAGPAKARQDP